MLRMALKTYRQLREMTSRDPLRSVIVNGDRILLKIILIKYNKDHTTGGITLHRYR